MTRRLIVILIVTALVLVGYEAATVLYLTMTVRETARSHLDRAVVEKNLQHVRLPDPPHVWPDSERFLKGVLVKKAIELEIPVGEQDIAIWHDNSKVYCRIAWYQDLKVLTFSFGSMLLDLTEEVPIK